MEIAFSYKADTDMGQPIEGVVYAANEQFARTRLKRAGLFPSKITINPGATLSGFFATEFDQKDLARLYGTLGKRINNGRSVQDGLMPAAEFVSDPRLKQAILVIRQSLADGASLSQGMVTAGFDPRDAMAIRAAESSGKTGDAFLSLSVDVYRRQKMSAQLKSMFFMPKIMLIGLYVASFFAVWMLAPKLQKFMGAVNMQMETQDALQAGYFALSDWVNDNFILGVAAWVIPIVLLIAWMKSPLFEKVMDKLESWRLISEKSDMASTWTAFGLLYDAGVPPYECSRIVKGSARRHSSTEAWASLEKNFLSGMGIAEAVGRSALPPYIVSALKAADSSGASIPDEIKGITTTLEEDVSLLTERFQVVADLWIKIILSLCIFFAAQVTILPYLRMVMSNA